MWTVKRTSVAEMLTSNEEYLIPERVGIEQSKLFQVIDRLEKMVNSFLVMWSRMR